MEAGFRRRQPGLGLSADDFDGFIAAASAEIEAMGRFIEAYLSGRGNLVRLRRAWCNAVYWFHEGLSEPLDAVATVKLETAIENLFLAESTAKAKKRMLEGLEGMFGFSKSETVSPLSDVTFKKLADDIAKTRSSVLHGTSPTLPGRDLGVDRSLVEGMTRQLLIGYPRLVETYERETDAAKDDIEALLKWAKTRRGGEQELRGVRGMEGRIADGNTARDGVRGAEGAAFVRSSANETEEGSDEIAVGPGAGSMTGFVSAQAVQSTLAGALQAAGGIEDCADRATVLARIAALLHRVDDESGAANCVSLALAFARKIPEGAMRASALGCIARVQAGTGDREGARLTVAEAGEALGAEIGGGDRPSALGAIAKAEAAIGEYAAAMGTAGRLEDRFERDRLLSEIAGLATTAAAFGDALSAVRTITRRDMRTQRLASVARAQGRFGDVSGAGRSVAEALETAREIEDQADHLAALVDVCGVQVAIEDDPGAARSMADAVSLAGTIEDECDRVFALAHIARNQPRHGEASGAARTIAGALEVTGRMASGRARASALCWIAEAQARSGDCDGALRSIGAASEAATGVVEGSELDDILRDIALAQATAGDDRAALATARRFTCKRGNDGLLADIAEVQCWEGHFSEAVATAGEIECAEARCARAGQCRADSGAGWRPERSCAAGRSGGQSCRSDRGQFETRSGALRNCGRAAR